MEQLRKEDIIVTAMAFLMGFLSTAGVMYLFSVGSTNISLVIVLSVICNAYFILVKNNKVIENVFVILPKSIVFFYVSIFLSILQTLFFSYQYLYRWFVGIINVLLLFCVISAVYYLKDNFEYIMRGLVVGIFVNTMLVAYEYLNYMRGIIYRSEILMRLFPKSRFYEANTYNAFRAMGMFSEPGHLARFLAIFVPILFGWYYKKNTKLSFLILCIGFVDIMLTRSAVAAYFMVCIVFCVLYLLEGERDKILWLLAIVAVLVIVMIGIILFTSFGIKIWESLISGFEDLLVASKGADSSSVIRRQGIKAGIQIIKDYFFLGVGWNELTSHMMDGGYYSEADRVYGTYSGIITMAGQIGFGTIFYVYFIISSFLRNLHEDIIGLSISASLFIMFLVFCTTDLNYNDMTAFLFAIIIFMNKNEVNLINKINDNRGVNK